MPNPYFPMAILVGIFLASAAPDRAHAQRDPQPRSIGGQCAQEVGAQYNAAEARWYFYGKLGASPQFLRFLDCIDRRTLSRSGTVQSMPAPAPCRRVARREAKRVIAEEYQARSTLNGVETRIAAMNYVNSDCSSGPLPEVRIVTAPINGELRMEPIKHAVSRKKSNARFHCNGKIVDAVAVFYKSKAQHVGVDKIVLDVDFKVGEAKRFFYVIDVR